MLDTETKRRIDTARDILVGKVPDPKSQVEQITIALIYKFMDDMDAEAEDLGGKRKFFTGDYARYGWAKLMDRGLGGHAMLALYAEGITKMPENPGIPLLFREIFKNAFLPYRDPETLKAFLKIIDEFSYDHSERLGDAFEYLLSVLGSQGDAGQFRTPRHIIDFMVAVVDPQKTETVLDPACGTAGFLISSYKHILRANTETPLTPDERGRLALNFKGYDISPDMVRLSLVNLYLHGFTDPHIYEYDTLTSEERWNEYADVILANPPFMSPKGGIKPHKRFSIQAKRSEVLFVDYMAEHLTPAGRAAIIVPEGVIFQSQTAYKDLRRLLVENYLVAVVSLPAGCFNPYSGVKTSILMLDKSLARQSQTIAFFKVEKDGYGLGAQRRPLCSDKGDKPEHCPAHSDLPQVQIELEMYLQGQGLRVGQFSANGAPPFQPGASPQENVALDGKGLKARTNDNDKAGFQPSDDFSNPDPGALPQAEMSCAVGAPFTCGLIVPKEKIAANGDYNLSGERYRENGTATSSYPFVELGDVCEIYQPKTITQQDLKETGAFVVYGANGVIGRYDQFNHEFPEVIITCRGATCGTVNYSAAKSWITGNAMVVSPKTDGLLKDYLFQVLRHSDLSSTISGSAQPQITRQSLAPYQIPLPPLEVQKEIVAEIEGYQKVINGARAVLDHYRPYIPIHPDWPTVTIGSLVDSILLGIVRNKSEQDPKHPHPYIKMNNISNDGSLNLDDLIFVEASREELERFTLLDGDFIYNTRNAPDLVGKSAVFHGKSGTYLFNNNILRIRFGTCALPDFVNTIMNSDYGKAKIRAQVDGTTSVAALYQKNYLAIEIPLPPLATQQAIVAEIEAEQALVAANRELITRFERKIQATLARIWGEAESDSANGAPLSQLGATPQENVHKIGKG